MHVESDLLDGIGDVGVGECQVLECHTRFLRPKPDAHLMYAQDQVVIHTVRM
jgi:hypothetical protein